MNSEALLCLAGLYADHRDLTMSTVSNYMGGSGDTLARLERGCDITSRRLERFLTWFAAHWPDDLDWPDGIPRPAPRPRDAA